MHIACEELTDPSTAFRIHSAFPFNDGVTDVEYMTSIVCLTADENHDGESDQRVETRTCTCPPGEQRDPTEINKDRHQWDGSATLSPAIDKSEKLYTLMLRPLVKPCIDR